jgi:uncharacterized SAM-binding protein YcdF (DUF218 family)
VTAREIFCAVVTNQPVRHADAIVVLCGEDGRPRMEVGVQFYRANVAPTIVLSGGLDEPPRLMGARTLYPMLLGHGITAEAILVEDQSRNTHEQAVYVIDLAREHGWWTLVVIASPGHAYRAFLTFLRELQRTGLADRIRLVVAQASQVPWWGAPDGMTTRRIDLLDSEFQRIGAYGDHVASFEDALAYLEHWESR